MRRLKSYLLGAIVLLPLLNAIVTPMGLRGYPLQVAIAAVYGAVLGLWRLGPALTAACTMAVCLVTVKVVTGGSLLSLSFGSVMSLALYGALGYAIGISDDLTRDEA